MNLLNFKNIIKKIIKKVPYYISIYINKNIPNISFSLNLLSSNPLFFGLPGYESLFNKWIL